MKTAPPRTDDLGTRAGRALGWSLANTALARLGTVGIGIALARLLGPTAFGTFAVATVALLAVLSFNELGISLAIVRWPGDPHTIAPTVATLSVATSSILFVGTWFTAPVFATAMGEPSATPVVRLMCVCIVLNGLVAAPAALMQREFMQKQRMIIDQLGVWVGAGVSIALAVMGTGAMSLAVGRIAASVLSAVLFVHFAPNHLRFGFEPALLRPLLRFGLPLAGASAVVFVASYADQIVAGSALGATELGFYVLAFNLASWPIALFSGPLRSVAPAMLARLQDRPAEMTDVFLGLAGVLAAVSLPVCAVVAAAARPIVAFVYGDEWARSADVLTWLAAAAGARILFELVYDYLVVTRRSSTILVVQVAWTVALVPALVIASHYGGLAGIALAQFVVALLVALPLYLLALRSVGSSTSRLARRLLVPAGASCFLALGVAATTSQIGNSFVACAVAGSLCAATVAALGFSDRAAIARLRSARIGDAS
ncbi:lipopolysaccharide biosynthesis protein [Rhodococcoides trifolii]|uniref:Lipopolysaccharide biosynthesis protein n=1 Tax=Rhodococcoides trifolii TaxID=908250 RepID=A0A917CKD7_9NOCA|nr:oligosaccharide flippase family protein [Rhodococcus trifolii]GGF90397.1 lipopolysaccharide biosynthesis protein [Rhodococcus trifolii]